MKLTNGQDRAVQGRNCAAGKRLQLGDQMNPRNDGIDAQMRGGAVTAFPLDTNPDRIGGGMCRSVNELHSDAELAARRKTWQAPPYKAVRGTLYKYIKNVKPASEGCVTDE